MMSNSVTLTGDRLLNEPTKLLLPSLNNNVCVVHKARALSFVADLSERTQNEFKFKQISMFHFLELFNDQIEIY